MGGEIELEVKVLEVGLVAIGREDADFACQRGEGVAIVEDVGCACLAAQRPFAAAYDAEAAELEGVGELLGVARLEVHVHHAREGIAILCCHGAAVEVGVGQHVRAQGADNACAHAKGIGEVVGAVDFDALQAPREALRGIAVYGDTVVVGAACHAGKRGDQTGGVAVAAGIAAGLLHAEHTGADKGPGVDGLLFGHGGAHHNLAQHLGDLIEGEVDNHLLVARNQHLLHLHGCEAQNLRLNVVTSGDNVLYRIVALLIGGRIGGGALQYDGSPDDGLAGFGLGHHTTQGLCINTCAARQEQPRQEQDPIAYFSFHTLFFR